MDKLQAELESLPHHMQLFRPDALEVKNRDEAKAAAALSENPPVPTAPEFSPEDRARLLKLLGGD